MSKKDEIRTVPESYAMAMTSTNLKLDPNTEQIGDVDVLIAAGWNPTRIGAALLRLQTEWDSGALAKPIGREHFEAACLRDAQADAAKKSAAAGSKAECEAIKKAVGPSAKRAAMDMATAGNLTEARLLMMRLKTMPGVLLQLRLQLSKWKLESSEEVANAVLRWWLQRSCKECNATGFAIKTGKLCKSCTGAGQLRPPCGPTGIRLANFMDDCVHRSGHFMGKVLRHRRG